MLGFSRWSQRYQPLRLGNFRVPNEVEEGDSEEKHQSNESNTTAGSWSGGKHILQSISLSLTVLILVLQAVIIFRPGPVCSTPAHLHDSLHNQPNSIPETKGDLPRLCGTSAQEATALGCSFDQLIWSWLPPRCPHYANNEFVQLENWTYWMDNQKKEAVTREDWARALNNEVELWGESREHLAHCVYIFLSIAQILRDRTPYPSYFRDYGHTAHCAGVLMEALRKEPKRNRIATFVGNVSFEQQCVEL